MDIDYFLRTKYEENQVEGVLRTEELYKNISNTYLKHLFAVMHQSINGLLSFMQSKKNRIIGKEWMQLIISVFGGYILGKIDTTLANGQFFSTIELIFMTLICIVFMIMSNVFSKQSLKNEAISYYSIVDILVYERNILNELIMSWNIC